MVIFPVSLSSYLWSTVNTLGILISLNWKYGEIKNVLTKEATSNQYFDDILLNIVFFVLWLICKVLHDGIHGIQLKVLTIPYKPVSVINVYT